MTKLDALAKYLECPLDHIDANDYSSFDYKNGRETYLVLTDREADQRAKDGILDSLWAFNASFLAAHCDLDEGQIKSIQGNGKYEDNNPIFKRLILDLDHFVSDAILSDGRGPFIGLYDGEENEIQVKDALGYKTYYIYRTN